MLGLVWLGIKLGSVVIFNWPALGSRPGLILGMNLFQCCVFYASVYSRCCAVFLYLDLSSTETEKKQGSCAVLEFQGHLEVADNFKTVLQ